MNLTIFPENDLPIGVFDSGIGGLTVLLQLKNFLPNDFFLLFG
jgi:glutamate racemase